MPTPTALDGAYTGTPDAGAGTQVGTVVSAESTSIEIPIGVELSDHIASNIGTHRSGVTGADTCYVDLQAFGSTSPAAELINNRGALAIWVNFVSSSGRATVAPVFYDAQTTPFPTALGPQIAFSAFGAAATSGGKLVSRVQLVDTYGFRKFKVYVETMSNSTGGMDIYAVPV